MYGCDSCGIKEHQIPLFFTRYFNKTLPYSGQDIIKKYNLKQEARKTVLISPSVYAKSFLTSKAMVESLVKLKESDKAAKFDFIVKLHGYCFFNYEELENGAVRSHPLHSLSDSELENIKILKEHFTVAAETEYNVLPFLEVADIVSSCLSETSLLFIFFSLHLLFIDLQTVLV